MYLNLHLLILNTLEENSQWILKSFNFFECIFILVLLLVLYFKSKSATCVVILIII